MAPEHETTGGPQVSVSSIFIWLKLDIISKIQAYDETFALDLLGLLDHEATSIQEERQRHAEEISQLQSIISSGQAHGTTSYSLEADDGASTNWGKSTKENSVSSFEEKEEEEEVGPGLDLDATMVSKRNTFPPAREQTLQSYDDSSRASSAKPYLWDRELIQTSSTNCYTCDEKLQKQRMEIIELRAKIDDNAKMYANFAEIAVRTSDAQEKRLKDIEELLAKLEQEKKELEQKAADDASEASRGRENLGESRKTIKDLTATYNSARRCDNYHQKKVVLEQRRKSEVVSHLKIVDALAKERLVQIKCLKAKLRSTTDTKLDKIKALQGQQIISQSTEDAKRATADDPIPMAEDEAQFTADRTQSAEDRIPEEEKRKLKQLQKDYDVQTKALATAQRHLLILEPVVKMAAKIRLRFWVSGKPKIDDRESICESGNRAAHDGNLETDMALLASGFIKADRLSVFRLIYDFDPWRYIPSYSGLEDLELSKTAIDFLNMRATISTHILVEPTDADVAIAVKNFLSLNSEWKAWYATQASTQVGGPEGHGTRTRGWDVASAGDEPSIEKMRGFVGQVQRYERQLRMRKE